MTGLAGNPFNMFYARAETTIARWSMSSSVSTP